MLTSWWHHNNHFHWDDNVIYDCNYEFEKNTLNRKTKKRWIQKNISLSTFDQNTDISHNNEKNEYFPLSLDTKANQNHCEHEAFETRCSTKNIKWSSESVLDRLESHGNVFGDKTPPEAEVINEYFNSDFLTNQEVFFCTDVYKDIIEKHVLSLLGNGELLSLSLVNTTLRNYVYDYFYEFAVPDFIANVTHKNKKLRSKMYRQNPQWTRLDLYRNPEYINARDASFTYLTENHKISYNLGLGPIRR